MSTSTKLIIGFLFLITFGLVGVALYVVINYDTFVPITDETAITCTLAGSERYFSCEEKIVYNAQCEEQKVAGFSCNGYKEASPGDICNKQNSCNGKPDNHKCADAGKTLEICERCSAGKSSSVKVTQGENGCEYEYGICQESKNCGSTQAPTNESQTNATGTRKSCADGRDVGEVWKECCTGSDSGKIQVLKKGENCNIEIVSSCISDTACTPNQAKFVPEPSITPNTNEQIAETLTPTTTTTQTKPIEITTIPTQSSSIIPPEPTIQRTPTTTTAPTASLIPIAQNLNPTAPIMADVGVSHTTTQTPSIVQTVIPQVGNELPRTYKSTWQSLILLGLGFALIINGIVLHIYSHTIWKWVLQAIQR